jgi:hypothetical protein
MAHRTAMNLEGLGLQVVQHEDDRRTVIMRLMGSDGRGRSQEVDLLLVPDQLSLIIDLIDGAATILREGDADEP